MKIVVIGASGTIGKGVVAELGRRHDIVEVGRSSGTWQVDVLDRSSIARLFERVGSFDAVITTIGKIHIGTLSEMTAEQFDIGLRDKLMGQVNVVLAAQSRISDGGSFTLTSGILGEQPIRYGANAACVNAAIEGFVRGAALDLARGVRINAVSPTILEESLDAYGPYMRGFEPAPASRVALAYSRSVEGAQTGCVYRVW